MNPLVTNPYKVSRVRLAYVASEEYIRTFWYWMISIPIAGIAFLVSGIPTLQGIGVFALMWPFTIPGRALLISTKASRLFNSGVVMRVTENEIEFLGQTPGASGKPMRMAIARDMVRDVQVRQGVMILRTFRQAFAPIDPAAFGSDEEREQFVRDATAWRDAPELP